MHALTGEGSWIQYPLPGSGPGSLAPLRDMQGRLLYNGGGGIVTSGCQKKQIIANTDNQGKFFLARTKMSWRSLLTSQYSR